MRRQSFALLALTFAASACSLTQPDGHLPVHGGPGDRMSQAATAFYESINGIMPCYALIGRVVDDDSFSPLAGLSVVVGDSTSVNQTRTGIDGNFRFDSLGSRADWIEFRQVDGRTARMSLTFIASDSTKRRVRMVDPNASNRMFVRSSIANIRASAQGSGMITNSMGGRYCDYPGTERSATNYSDVRRAKITN